MYLQNTSNKNILNLINFVYGDVLIGYSFNGITVANNNLIFNSSNILSGNTFYTNQLQPIMGSMLNNGELNFTPSAQEQTIPEGYTSGGTVAAVDYSNTLSPEEYTTALNTAKQIKGGNA